MSRYQHAVPISCNTIVYFSIMNTKVTKGVLIKVRDHKNESALNDQNEDENDKYCYFVKYKYTQLVMLVTYWRHVVTKDMSRSYWSDTLIPPTPIIRYHVSSFNSWLWFSQHL